MAGSAEVTDEAVTRLVVRAVGAAIAFLLASSVGVVVSRAEVEGPAAAPRSAAGPIGPLPGADIGRHAVARRAALAALDAPAVAVASLAGYRDEGPARALATRAGVEVVALLVAAPNGEPQAVTDDIDGFREAERARARAERDELASVLRTTTDPDFIAQYREDIARLDRLLGRLGSARDLVFGLVVEGTADELRALGDDPDVRLVDVADGTGRPPLDQVKGLRPEETTRAAEPRSRPDDR